MDDDVLELTSSSDSEHHFFSSQAHERTQKNQTSQSHRDNPAIVVNPNIPHCNGHNHNQNNTSLPNQPQNDHPNHQKRLKSINKNTKPHPNHHYITDVIDLTDSEPEYIPPTRSRSKKPPVNALAGPSRVADPTHFMHLPHKPKQVIQPYENDNDNPGPLGSNHGNAPVYQIHEPGLSPIGVPSEIDLRRGVSPGRKRKQPLFLPGSEDEDERGFEGDGDGDDERVMKKGRQNRGLIVPPLHPGQINGGDDLMGVEDMAHIDRRVFPPWEGFNHVLFGEDVPPQDDQGQAQAMPRVVQDLFNGDERLEQVPDVVVPQRQFLRHAQLPPGHYIFHPQPIHYPQHPQPPLPQGLVNHPQPPQPTHHPHAHPQQPAEIQPHHAQPQHAQPQLQQPQPVQPQPAQLQLQPQPAQPAQPSKNTLISQVLEIIPDVCPTHLSGLIDRNIAQFGERTGELVVGMLFEDAGYPRVESRGVKRGGASGVAQWGDGGEGQRADGGEGDEDEDERNGNRGKRRKVDYMSLERDVPGVGYEGLALATLQLYFAHIPRKYLCEQLHAHRSLYAPTHLALLAAEKRYEHHPKLRKPYEKSAYTKLNGRNGEKGKGKGKGRAKPRLKPNGNLGGENENENGNYDGDGQEGDDEGGGGGEVQADENVRARFNEELGWLEGYLAGGGEEGEGANGYGNGNEDLEEEGGEIDHGKRKGKGKEKAIDVGNDDSVEGEAEIECGCCFGEYPFSQMVQCPEAHLFCKTCLTTYASTQLSSLSCVINCMSSNPTCSLPFPTSELHRALPPNLLKLYDRVTQQDEIAKAGLEGLEECPFCEWKCVMEISVEEDKLFRCGNEDGGCGVVSCRMCKKLDHLPKSCQEVEEDKVLDGRHAIEEAMTAALMRNCPNCKKAFIKEQGCNKMTCPHCRTLSCYICRQIIKGYDHFDQMPGQQFRPGSSKKPAKCSLWDKVEERSAQEVKEAHDKAMAQYRKDHPDVETDALKVDLPKAPPAPAPPAGHQHPGLAHIVRRGRGRGAAVPHAMYHQYHHHLPRPVPPALLVPLSPPRRSKRVSRLRAAAAPPPHPIPGGAGPPVGGAFNIPPGQFQMHPEGGGVGGGVYNHHIIAANNPAIAHLLAPHAPPGMQQHQHQNFDFEAFNAGVPRRLQGVQERFGAARTRAEQEMARQQLVQYEELRAAQDQAFQQEQQRRLVQQMQEHQRQEHQRQIQQRALVEEAQRQQRMLQVGLAAGGHQDLAQRVGGGGRYEEVDDQLERMLRDELQRVENEARGQRAADLAMRAQQAQAAAREQARAVIQTRAETQVQRQRVQAEADVAAQQAQYQRHQTQLQLQHEQHEIRRQQIQAHRQQMQAQAQHQAQPQVQHFHFEADQPMHIQMQFGNVPEVEVLGVGRMTRAQRMRVQAAAGAPQAQVQAKPPNAPGR